MGHLALKSIVFNANLPVIHAVAEAAKPGFGMFGCCVYKISGGFNTYLRPFSRNIGVRTCSLVIHLIEYSQINK